MTVETFITAEALRVAEEEVAYREADEWSLAGIAEMNGIHVTLDRKQLVQALARRWQYSYEPYAREREYHVRKWRRRAA